MVRSYEGMLAVAAQPFGSSAQLPVPGRDLTGAVSDEHTHCARAVQLVRRVLLPEWGARAPLAQGDARARVGVWQLDAEEERGGELVAPCGAADQRDV